MKSRYLWDVNITNCNLLFQYSWAAGLSKTPPVPERTARVWGSILDNIKNIKAEQATRSKWTLCFEADIFFENFDDSIFVSWLYVVRVTVLRSISSLDFLALQKIKISFCSTIHGSWCEKEFLFANVGCKMYGWFLHKLMMRSNRYAIKNVFFSYNFLKFYDPIGCKK